MTEFSDKIVLAYLEKVKRGECPDCGSRLNMVEDEGQLPRYWCAKCPFEIKPLSETMQEEYRKFKEAYIKMRQQRNERLMGLR